MSFGLNEHRSPHNVGFGYALNGTAEGIRTPDLLVRSQTLYPAELPAHMQFLLLKYINTIGAKSQHFFTLGKNKSFFIIFRSSRNTVSYTHLTLPTICSV